MAAVSPSRRVASSILLSIEKSQKHSDDLLRGKQVAALSPADRNLVTTLVLGTLRWQIELDRRVRPLLKHPNAKLDPEVLIALRLGAFQLLHLDRIPARAAIDESVELTKQSGHQFASRMVNAVLRKLAASRETASPANDPQQAHPGWLLDRWVSSFGTETACAICEHNQHEPGATIRVLDLAAEDELRPAGIELEPGQLLTAARRVRSGDVSATPAFHEGRVRIQDEGSQLVAELVPHGNSILDCCAAPGGKTLILAERNPDAHILACEPNPQRLAKLRDRLRTVGPRIETREQDATALADVGIYDAVLADVPCSGTGTLGRNPEIRHRLSLDDLPRQAERQRAILRAAIRAAKPGGFIVYSTCSLEPDENEHVIAAVLAESADVSQLSLSPRIAELQTQGILTEAASHELHQSLLPDGSLRLIPGAFATDGFFVALLRKS